MAPTYTMGKPSRILAHQAVDAYADFDDFPDTDEHVTRGVEREMRRVQSRAGVTIAEEDEALKEADMVLRPARRAIWR